MSQQPLLHIDDLHVHFNTSDGVVQAINGASLTLNPGEDNHLHAVGDLELPQGSTFQLNVPWQL